MPFFILFVLLVAFWDEIPYLLLKLTLFIAGIGALFIVVGGLLAGILYGFSCLVAWIAKSYEDPESVRKNGSLPVLPADAEEEPFPVDLNFASRESLIRVPFIGEATARTIIDNRPYHDVRDLLQVEGIGPRKFHHFEDLVRV